MLFLVQQGSPLGLKGHTDLGGLRRMRGSKRETPMATASPMPLSEW